MGTVPECGMQMARSKQLCLSPGLLSPIRAKHWSLNAIVYNPRYVDMTAGIAVNALGHSDKRWQATLIEQAGKLAHTSNLYHTSAQVNRTWVQVWIVPGSSG